MGKIIFGGLGISKGDISLKLIETAKKCNKIYLETYTSLIPEITKEYLENLFNKKVFLLERSDLEENSKRIIKEAKEKDILILFPGDPFLFTTHHSLYLEAKKQKIKTEIIHGISIYSAAISSSGLQIYKFGKSTSIPKPTKNYEPESFYNILKENLKSNLHTLFILDKDLSGSEGLKILLDIEKKKKEKIIPKKVIIGSCLGSKNEKVKYGETGKLIKEEFKPPAFIIIPGKLHFIEKEFLKNL